MCFKTVLRYAFLLSVFLPALRYDAGAQLLRKSANWLIYHSIVDTTSAGDPSFRIYPTLAYAPETSFELGFSTLYLFQARRDTTNRLSELNAFTFITLEKQYGIWLDNAIYGHKDKWFVFGRTRYQRFPLLYYGIGPNTLADHPAVIDANYLIFRQRVLPQNTSQFICGP